uniref:Uncharacterized protein n=1 Tax=Nelumbo nucifera TaxID=4432 RepID=A0A822XI88_NELNU|nr:TPA_asm: hypothetical protein HUJ06_020876 [Nelumbo nucifera]
MERHQKEQGTEAFVAKTLVISTSQPFTGYLDNSVGLDFDANLCFNGPTDPSAPILGYDLPMNLPTKGEMSRGLGGEVGEKETIGDKG